MKKITSLSMALFLLLLMGCTENETNANSTRFLLDTVVTLDIECDKVTLNEAFSLCEKYEKQLSKTVKESDVSKLNNANIGLTVKKDTAKLIERSLYYGKLSGGKFDITICPVSNLWDFEGTALPDKKEIAEAIKNVDYESIEIDGNTVNLNGKQIDLGGIAKGFICDKLLEFFKSKNVKSGTINLGGNVLVFGEKLKTIGIKKPFSDDEISAKLKVKDKSVVTSGIYERYINIGTKIFHHILDPKTGYATETDLCSATIIGNTSLDCDALSTVCILLGKEKATKLIENTKNTEAVFIDRNNKITYTSGLNKKNGVLILK